MSSSWTPSLRSPARPPAGLVLGPGARGTSRSMSSSCTPLFSQRRDSCSCIAHFLRSPARPPAVVSARPRGQGDIGRQGPRVAHLNDSAPRLSAPGLGAIGAAASGRPGSPPSSNPGTTSSTTPRSATPSPPTRSPRRVRGIRSRAHPEVHAGHGARSQVYAEQHPPRAPEPRAAASAAGAMAILSASSEPESSRSSPPRRGSSRSSLSGRSVEEPLASSFSPSEDLSWRAPRRPLELRPPTRSPSGGLAVGRRRVHILALPPGSK
jgi:hypothetical protein